MDWNLCLAVFSNSHVYSLYMLGSYCLNHLKTCFKQLLFVGAYFGNFLFMFAVEFISCCEE